VLLALPRQPQTAPGRDRAAAEALPDPLDPDPGAKDASASTSTGIRVKSAPWAAGPPQAHTRASLAIVPISPACVSSAGRASSAGAGGGDEISPLLTHPSAECLGVEGEDGSLSMQPPCLRPVLYSAPGLDAPLQGEASLFGETAPTQKRIHNKMLLKRERISPTKPHSVLISDLSGMLKPPPSVVEEKTTLDREEEPKSTLTGTGCVGHSLLGQRPLRGSKDGFGRSVVRKNSSPPKAKALKPVIREPATGWEVMSPFPSHRLL